MNPSEDLVRSILQELNATLGSRASGLWRVEGDHLIRVLFEPGPDLAPGIAARFSETTRRVGLDQLTLGIVKAAVDRSTAVSRVSELDPRAGSGYWLRVLGAERSVAVPLFDPKGSVWGVLSVGVCDSEPSDREVEGIVRSSGRRLGPRSSDV